MPKVKNPLLSMEARGGIGGLVYNTWRGINYVKTNTSPTGQGTEKRLAAQALMAQASALWAGLSDEERAGWTQYGTDHPVPDWTGSPKRLTGMNWFVGCTIQLLRLGESAIDTAPVVPAPDPIVGLTIAFATKNITMAWSAPVAATDFLDVWIVGPHSAGRTPKIEQAHFLVSDGADSVSPITLVDTAALGRYTVFARVVDSLTGLTSTWLSGNADAT